MKKTCRIMLFIILLNSSIGQTNNKIVQPKQEQNFRLFGRWKLIKRISLDVNNPLSKEESLQCSESIINFTNSSFILPRTNCFTSYVCSTPNYKIQKVNTLEYFERDTSYIKLIGFKESIKIITTNCELPFDSMVILDTDNICFGMDGYEYFLQRVTIH